MRLSESFTRGHRPYVRRPIGPMALTEARRPAYTIYMRNNLAASMCFAALLLSARSAQAKTIQFEQYILPNGLTVVLNENPSSPVVSIGIWFKVGSKNEETGRTGFAHLFEHYMFEEDYFSGPKDYYKVIDGMGASSNADTAHDRTFYYATVPSEGLEEALRITSNGIISIPLTLSPEALERQRSIVKNEKRMYENEPYGLEDAVFDKFVWGDNHPYGHQILGSIEDLDAASLDDVRRFYDTYYAISNAVLAVSGGQDSKETLAMVKKWFGTIPSSPAPAAVKIPPYKPAGRKELKLKDDKAQLTRVTIAYQLPGKGKPGNTELSVAADVLGGARTSRLVQSLQYEKRLVTSISAGVYGLHEADLFCVRATPAPGVTAEQVEEAVNAEIEKLINGGITEDEFEIAKAKAVTEQMDKLQDAGQLAAELAEGAAMGDPVNFESRVEEIMKMLPDAPQKAAARYLKKDAGSVLVTEPGAQEES